MSLPDFEAWAIFAAVARLGSFTAAAGELNLSKPTVSKAITRLEKRLDTVLFHRTSRKISLSSAGHALLPHARQIALDGEAAMDAARDTTHLLRGQVRMAAPLSYGLSHLAPVIADFMSKYPEIAIDVQLSDARVDLVEEGFDLAVRIGALPDSSLRAIALRPIHRHFVASPAYLDRKGTPRHPSELSEHDCFIYSNLPTPETWHLTGPDGEKVSVQPHCRMRSNNGSLELAALVAGHGISNLPDFLVDEQLRSGELVSILKDWDFEPINLNIVMPPSPLRPARVNALIDHLKEQLR
ncbi:DNA-binding transcriptional regulator, LysR family [Parasphingorhabdus marina DSM 22363]|uniref:DNA-binding transcriptional regulator, LysR family n=1 Tax=Parasphingorhabdus marina DSM 22363 TaxID=1123272 RepID=A0A1N6CUD9_9SPHN|nr:LysR family transcriptional regulator [Parasphingorhabdus marina]SIN62086.1 DNA-binding transcriptional regulator, LysR family [Parasphingorhabdus marina DSM 22363]